MADVITGATETGPTKEQKIAAVVQRELIEGSVVAQRSMDWSFLAEPGASQIDVPKGDSFVVTNRAEGVAGDASPITYDTDPMPLDENAYLAWIVDYKSKVQSRIDVQLDMAARAARAHTKYLDERIIAKGDADAGYVAPLGVITYATVLDLVKRYLKAEGNIDQATLLVGMDAWATLMDIPEFKQAEIYGSANIPSGIIGKIHGVDVVRSTKMDALRADSFMLFDKDALGFGIQAGPSMSEQGANEYGSQAKRVVLDQLFGTWTGFHAQQGAAAGKSPLILKDGNP